MKNILSWFVSLTLWLLLGVVYSGITTFLSVQEPGKIIFIPKDIAPMSLFSVGILLFVLFYLSLRGMRRARLIGWAGPISAVIVMLLFWFSAHVTNAVSSHHIETLAVTPTINVAYLPHLISYLMAMVWLGHVSLCKCSIFMRRKQEG